MTTWKFPDELGGGTYEEDPPALTQVPAHLITFLINNKKVCVARSLLTEVRPPPPIEASQIRVLIWKFETRRDNSNSAAQHHAGSLHFPVTSQTAAARHRGYAEAMAEVIADLRGLLEE